MIPYVDPPAPIFVLGVRLPVFGLLLFVALLVTYAAIVRRGRDVVGGAPGAAERLARVVLLAGVLGAHVGGVLGDHGLAALARPSRFLAADGTLSSGAGLLVAGVAGALHLRSSRREVRAWADVVAWAFPFGLFVARMGCAWTHDHVGRLSSSWLAVRFPAGSRFDCGLLEWLAAPLLVALALVLGRRPEPAGRLAGAIGAAYVAIRFPLDFLRAADLPGADARFAGLTFMQWVGLPLLAASGYIWTTARIQSTRFD